MRGPRWRSVRYLGADCVLTAVSATGFDGQPAGCGVLKGEEIMRKKIEELLAE